MSAKHARRWYRHAKCSQDYVNTVMDVEVKVDDEDKALVEPVRHGSSVWTVT